MDRFDTELAVVGGGPAGLCAAIEAARLGVETTIVDENGKPGGQLFKQIHKFFGSHRHHAGVRGFTIGEQLLDEIEKLRVRVLLNSVAFGFFDNNIIGVYSSGEVSSLRARKAIIATGAIEKPLSFKGWTLPGVMGAGAVQTMINVHGVLPGTRVLMIGSGNVGLIVSYQLIQAGAEVVALVEALPEVSGWHVHAGKICRLGVPILLSHTIVETSGRESVERAVIAEVDSEFRIRDGTEKTFDVDLICVAVGLRPLIELAQLANCRLEYVQGLGGFLPLHDEHMRTSKKDVYVAGDITGIEEASTAMEEGKLAGISAAQSLGKLNIETFTMMSKVINTNMLELRLGTFGNVRRRCKEEIVRNFADQGIV
jgi:NADPH-dependent 2,4-dienoyl-CoA reductase/sulfur reductase-like enzyme